MEQVEHTPLTYHNRETGALVLKLSYGYTIESHDRDPLVDLVDKAMEEFIVVMLPLTWLVDFIPMCKSLETPRNPNPRIPSNI